MPKKKHVSPTNRTRKKVRRAPRINVRRALLGALEKKASERFPLRAELGCSMASLDFHLKELRAEGLVTAIGVRPKHFMLSSKTPDTALIGSGTGNSALSQALDQIQKHLLVGSGMPRAQRVPEKVATLEQLAAMMPKTIAGVLLAIRDDYQPRTSA